MESGEGDRLVLGYGIGVMKIASDNVKIWKNIKEGR